MKARTQDEKFIIALYEESQKSDETLEVNRYSIGKKIALQERGVNAICKLLHQSNFIKKTSEDDIYITDRGVALAKQLLNEI